MDIQNYIENCRQAVNAALDATLPPETTQLHKAMRYAVLNGGKRIRSAFIYATGEALGADRAVLADICIAVEMIHAFSLVHDDLPALDNDRLRRGMPSCHIAFGEATAILAGDVLQSLAFETLATIDKRKISPPVLLEMVRLLADAIGSRGMIGGEELDIEMVNKAVTPDEVEAMYRLKTGCLLRVSILLAALAANCQDESILNNLSKFGECLGVSFQIHDDIIGIESTTSTLGKTQQADLESNKPVYPVLVGMEQAKKRRNELYNTAIEYLNETMIASDWLGELSYYVIKRSN